MKVIIENDLNISFEAKENIINYILPIASTIRIANDSEEVIDRVFINNKEVDINNIKITQEASFILIIFIQEQKREFIFKSIIDSIEKDTYEDINRDYNKNYALFSKQFGECDLDTIIERIKNKEISIFAVEEFVNVTNKKKQLEVVRKKYKNIKNICERPKTHLKSTNEIRPIETVKRVGYESIPYLASHSEDWLAKTAGGLKPARLFSRVEDINYEIYENRVVKSTIDLACRVFKTLSNKYEEDYEQLSSIIDTMFSSNIYGYDENFAKALSCDLFSANEQTLNKTEDSREIAETNRDITRELYRLFCNLKDTRLVKMLRNTKDISNPLQKTNILLMDKEYKDIPIIWEILHNIIGKKTIKKQNTVIDYYPFNTYLFYCLTICYYALNTLSFEYKQNGKFVRRDDICVQISNNSNVINVDLYKKNRKKLEITKDIISPINKGEKFSGFEFDGKYLYWDNKIDDVVVEVFCKKVFTTNNDYKIKNKERNIYANLKSKILAVNREEVDNKKRITVFPLFGLISESNSVGFRDYLNQNVNHLLKEQSSNLIVVTMPVCNKNEQTIINYGLRYKEKIAFLPVSLFEINSYRRLQKVFLKYLSDIADDSCPFCGEGLVSNNDRKICHKCNLIITDTQCSNEKCKHKYRYLYNSVKDSNIIKMKTADNSFYVQDGLFQYRDIVNLLIDDKYRIRPICPRCGQ